MSNAWLLFVPAAVVLLGVAFVRGWDFPDDEAPERDMDDLIPRVGGWRNA